MAGLSKHLALALFNMSLNPVRSSYTPPVGLWVSLHTSAPSDATYGKEATFAGYARQPLNSLSARVAAEVNGDTDVIVTNGSAVVFPASTSESGQTVSHWAIWDSEVVGDGNILYSGALSSSRLVVTGDQVVIPEGAVSITIK